MLVKQALSYLREYGISNENSVYILSHVLNQDKNYIYINLSLNLSDIQIENLKKTVTEHIEGLKPLAYIFREAYFFGERFISDERALIPRVETEILVDEAIRIIKKIRKPDIRILDLCTGSGIIPVILKKTFHEAVIYASDISRDAIDLATENAVLHGQKIEFILSDIFNGINTNQKFDIITANPPYIGTKEENTIDAGVLKYEPHLALFGGDDGLMFIDKILDEGRMYLKSSGYIIMETNSNQTNELKILCEKYNYTCDIIQDLSGRDRFLKAVLQN